MQGRLQQLSIPWCKQLSDKGLAALAANCTGLLALDVRGCGDAKRSEGSGASADKGVGEHPLTDAGIVQIATRCPSLTHLDVSHCHLISDASLRTVVLSCPMMDELATQGCPLVTDAALADIAAQCSLSILNIACCNVTDAGFVVVKDMPALHMLDISFCRHLTDAALEHLAAGCPQLTVLRAWGSRFSDLAVDSFQKQRPEVQIEHGHLPSDVLEPEAGTEEDDAGSDLLPRLSSASSASNEAKRSGDEIKLTSDRI